MRDIIKLVKKLLNNLYKATEPTVYENIQRTLGFSGEEYLSAMKYVEDNGYIVKVTIPGEREIIKLTTEGIKFLREEKANRIREIHSLVMVVATIVIAGATFYNALILSQYYSPIIGINFNCPRELHYPVNLEIYNVGRTMERMTLSISGENIEIKEIDSKNYTDRIEKLILAVPLEGNRPFRYTFNIKAKDREKDYASFTLSSSKGTYSLCEYEKNNIGNFVLIE